MKKYSLLVIIVIVALSIISGCAREPQVKVKVEQLKVAVVDQEQLWEKSKKAKDYQQQLNDKVEVLRKEYDTEIDNLSDVDKETKQEEVYQEINDLREKLKEKFRQDIAQAVEKIAQNQDYDVVLNKDEVRFGGEDITEKVLDEL
ncbi:OmpH family outer membrane protein [Halanaerobacter jeridensis]|uniref:Outer membrane protein n=1 Tax=Halanaerobacter jeridensis TaxID=706427 RepID=A0A938XT18_9FIRM|nr:OmpH family outer membrane protein [Halanaerobacter jeridensis]MBM7556990.1 outer membrane protein [Halanaerobacter jeridensis]